MIPENLDPAHLCLAVVDLQTRLMEVIHRADETAGAAALMVRCAQELKVKTLALTQYRKGLGAYVPELEELLADTPQYDKTAFNLLAVESVAQEIAARPELDTFVLVGVETHICIWQSALALLGAGKQVWVLSDAVSSRREEDHREALLQLRAAGAIVGPTEMLIYSLLGRAGTPEFKKIHSLITA